jgi:hypothetical protein
MSRTAVLLFLALPLAATGQQPNQYAPPKTQPPDAATIEKIKPKTAELKAEIAKLPKSAFQYAPDVEVYAKAGEWIVMLEEWFDPKAGEKTLAVLDAGLRRAAELRNLKPNGVPSWPTVRGKPVVWGYRSTVDDSIQPYSLTVPTDFDPTKPWRLDVVLHGRDATLTEVKFIHARETSKPPAKSADYVQLDVYGRGNNAYRWAGETDVEEATFAAGSIGVSPPRRGVKSATSVVLRGFSMGGAGTWHIGLHHPFDFSVIGPGAGFTTTRGYIKNFPANVSDYIDRCLHIYDAVDYAENLFNVPVVAYSGEKDPQKAAADNIFAKLRDLKEPVQATHLVAPGLEHRMPPEWQARADAEYRKYLHRVPVDAERVRFVTYTARYGNAGWATIEALDRQYDRAVLDGTWKDRKVDLATTNIRGLFLMGNDDKPVPKQVRIDGQQIKVPGEEGDKPATMATFRKNNGQWQHVGLLESMATKRTKPDKHDGLQGPIDDAFMGSFLVAAESGDGYPAVAAEQFRRIWRRYFRGTVREKDPKAVTEEDYRGRNLILFGTPETNPLIAKVLQKLPIRWTRDELEVNGVKYDAKTHVPVLIYPNPLWWQTGYVVINSGHTFREADLKGTNALLYPRLGDWAVLKPMPTKDDPAAYEVVAAGLFDEYWQFSKK